MAGHFPDDIFVANDTLNDHEGSHVTITTVLPLTTADDNGLLEKVLTSLGIKAVVSTATSNF